MLEVVPFPGTTLGDWQGKTRLSPQVPYGLTTQDIADKGGLAAMAKWDFELMGQRLMDDERCAGSGLAAYFVKGALDSISMLFTAVDGANIRLAGPLGARISWVPEINMAGFQQPSEETEEGQPLWGSVMPFMGLPHTIVVNNQGRRFGNEGFYRSFFYQIDVIDGTTQTHPNFPAG